MGQKPALSAVEGLSAISRSCSGDPPPTITQIAMTKAITAMYVMT
jgi:hypothetical protein